MVKDPFIYLLFIFCAILLAKLWLTSDQWSSKGYAMRKQWYLMIIMQFKCIWHFVIGSGGDIIISKASAKLIVGCFLGSVIVLLI